MARSSKNTEKSAGDTPKRMMQMRISDELHSWLKLKAVVDGTTMTNIVVSLLERLRAREQVRVKEF